MDKEFFMKNKKKIIIVVAAIAVSLIGFSLLNSTYSLFYHEETSKNTEGYSTGTLSITASSKGSTISLSDALPVEDSVGSTSTPYTFTISNTGNLNYKFNIKLLSTGSSSTTIGSQYIKLKVDNGSVTTLSSLSNGIIKKDVTLAAGESIDISVRVWLSISTPNSQIGKTFNSKIVIDGQAVYTETKEYTISYDLNGGTSSTPEPQTKLKGEAITLSNVTPTRSNYTFLGWSTTKNATTATYSAGELFTIDANTTLYAIWQKAGTVAEAYTVVFQKNVSGTITQMISRSIAPTLPFVLSFTAPTLSNAYKPSSISCTNNQVATLKFNGTGSGAVNTQSVTARIDRVTSSTVCTILYTKGDVS